MQFRLGHFQVARTFDVSPAERLQMARFLAEFDWLLTATDPLEKARIAERMRELKRPLPPAAPPDCLIETLPEDSPDREWLLEALAALGDASRGGGLVALQACEAAEGPQAPIVVAAYVRGLHAEVRRGDLVCAGFALRCAPDSDLEIFPRLFRTVCTNGAIMHAGMLPAHASHAAGLRAELKELLGRRAFETEVDALRVAASTPVGDSLEQLLSGLAHVDAAMRRRVREGLERRPDSSLWDLVNVLTALARGRRSWSARLDLEREAGGLLAHLRRPLPTHPHGLALQPPCEDERLEVHA